MTTQGERALAGADTPARLHLAGPDDVTGARAASEAGTPIEAQLTLPAHPRNIAVARRALIGLAEALLGDRELLSNLGLAVSEACAGAAMQGDDPRMLRLVLQVEPEQARVVVHDPDGAGPFTPHVGAASRLPLIAALVDELQIKSGPGGGTEVHMGFRRPHAA